ncbi:tetratricopeptide repeat protein [Pelodictyon phaeoclathratiforme]|jgi:tetratricopeptide (TPR) repeat protein|uniref:TPR repeat-containing protein n=1 Tax=Pelodictyon phaeoclathratiforme (strain DSM 5477 / BU-1) TaxID=324925 RepID=B4SGT7_PELPB|nr:tetratricopeptide repeat protein [Pelodictyon phaeoclathratiforme]ACF43500.1 TPR repeat-containing protein [Pelodictyon phaeoclathratiforme BU-1]MBV5290215.1 tetratricopeptide repeat protein [Pelodictyon phaeoclathratiforme]
MQNRLRFFYIAIIAFLFTGNVAYAHNEEAQRLLSSGEAYCKSGKNTEAIAELTKAIELEPKLSPADLSTAYYNRAVARRTIGDSLGSKADFEKVVDLDPTPRDAAAYHNRGIAKSTLGDKEGALVDMKKAALLGNIPAREWLKNNGEKNPLYTALDDAQNLLSSGKAKLASGDHKGAIVDFTKAIELDPKLAAAYFNRGIAKSLTGENKSSREDFAKSIKLDRTPKDAEAYCNRGIAKSAINDKKGALTDFNKAIDLDPKYREAYSRRGKLKNEMGDKAGSLADVKTATELSAIAHP